MNAVDRVYSLAEIKDFSDEELYKCLFECWNISNGKIEIWGELKANPNNGFIKLKNIKTLSENREISYPLNVMHNIESGIYIAQEYAKNIIDEQVNNWIKCHLELSPLVERIKRNNPFELSVKTDSVQRLIAMPISKDDIIENEGTSYLIKKIYDFNFSQVSDEIKEKKSVMELEFNKNTASLTEKLKKSEKKLTQITNDSELLAEQNSTLKVKNTKLEKNVSNRQQMLDQINLEYQKVEKEMNIKIDKLKSYISDKALFLKNFEFIDEDDFDMFISNTPEGNVVAEGVSFKNEFNGDYAKAVSYIQAYLKEKDILYPRHIIENYLTLIRSNDLIILAGDSGSGKTNLVQSFAKAVGGVSKIIPVKPNWTSSEDLLGYYNPLEKKYLATPFLEALIEAQQYPDIPYFICLDEMNLARVEYYFADFLSKLESREVTPEIQLYSDNESAHVLSELKAVISIISDAKNKFAKEGVVDFIKLMQDEDINTEMKRAFGFSDKNSLIKYHGDIRRMLTGVLSTPSSIKIPPNVRIIGAINIDETTHYLSPKILDRAHVMKFKSPLLTDWDDIFSEIESYGFEDVSKPVNFEIEALGQRKTYPKFERTEPFCELFVDLNKSFFNPLGVEFGMRTIRQGLNYIELFAELNDNRDQAINNFIIHKVLPKFTFDGNKQSGDFNKLDLLDKGLLPRLESVITNHESLSDEFSSIVALRNIISNAKANDGVVNYWA